MDVDVLIQTDDGSSHVRRFQLDGTPLSIGRTPDCTLYLPSDCVSRLHAVVHVDAQGLLVEDRSSNGTIVGNVHLHRDSLAVPFGTLLVVGEYALSLGPPGTVSAPEQIAPPGAQPAQPAPPPAGYPQPPAYEPDAPTGIPPRPHNPLAVTGAQPVAMWDAPTAIGISGDYVPQEQAAARAEIHIPAAMNPMPVPGVAVETLHGHGVPRPPPPPPPPPPPEPERDDPTADAARKEEVLLRREIHAKLLENLDLAKLDAGKLDDPSMRPRVLTALRRIVQQLDARIDPGMDRNTLVGQLADEALGLGPLERYLDDPNVTEVMVIDPDTIFIEQDGRLIKTDSRFTDDERVRAVIERIVTPLGRRIDESSPLVDARLADGSRVNAIIRPLALRGTCITIRKFARVPLTVDKLISYGSLTEAMARFLGRSVIAHKNILISGGTGSGKTTLLNVLSGRIPPGERIVTIEDAVELQLHQRHVIPARVAVHRTCRAPRVSITIRDLMVKQLAPDEARSHHRRGVLVVARPLTCCRR